MDIPYDFLVSLAQQYSEHKGALTYRSIMKHLLWRVQKAEETGEITAEDAKFFCTRNCLHCSQYETCYSDND